MSTSVYTGLNPFNFIREHYLRKGDFILRAFDYIVTISFGYILHCVCFNLYYGGFILFYVCVCVCCMCVCACARACFVMCVCVCMGFVMCGCFGNMYTVL